MAAVVLVEASSSSTELAVGEEWEEGEIPVEREREEAASSLSTELVAAAAVSSVLVSSSVFTLLCPVSMAWASATSSMRPAPARCSPCQLAAAR